LVQKGSNLKEETIILLPGGKIFMSQNKNGDIIMKGEVTSVFSGFINIK